MRKISLIRPIRKREIRRCLYTSRAVANNRGLSDSRHYNKLNVKKDFQHNQKHRAPLECSVGFLSGEEVSCTYWTLR